MAPNIIKIEKVTLTPAYPVPELKPGQLLIAELDKDGKESGVYFTTDQRTYDRSYTDETKFLIKKKHNQ